MLRNYCSDCLSANSSFRYSIISRYHDLFFVIMSLSTLGLILLSLFYFNEILVGAIAFNKTALITILKDINSTALL